jgi:signal transduction histidine kinase
MGAEELKSENERLTGALREQEERIRAMEIFLKAYEKVDKMASRELIEAERTTKSLERISDFSFRELQQRDMAMRNVLDINRDISSILEKNTLLARILDALVDTMKAQRGILYLNEKANGIFPFIFRNIDEVETKRDYFRVCSASVLECSVSRRSVTRMMEEIQDSGVTFTLSYICLPLLYQSELLGAIYLDIISEMKTFRVQDLDVAEIFASQAAISLNNAVLYDKIRQQNLELLKLVNLKDQLIEEVSKKIEKPLAEVKSLLQNGLNTCFDPGYFSESMVRKVFGNVDRMEVTLHKVLTIQELEREVNDLFSEKVDFRELFSFILQTHEEARAKKNVQVTMSLTPDFSSYNANRTIMRTVFDELLTNSIFYNKPDGKVDIRGFREGDYLVVEIADTGFGIRMEDQEHIFEQFYRTSDSPKLNEKGAGLGLYLARKFIKYYDGDIQVQSEYGIGSTFRVKMLVN